MSRVLRCLLGFACLALFLSTVVGGEDAKTDAAGKTAEIERLIKQLGDDDFYEREAASKALEDIGGPALEALVNATTTSDDAEVCLRADHILKALDALLNKPMRSFKGHIGGVNSVAFSPDGKWLASASNDETVKVWDINTAQAVHTLKGNTDQRCNVAFSPDGMRVASAGYNNLVKLWDAATGRGVLHTQGAYRGRLQRCVQSRRQAAGQRQQ